MIKKLSRRQNVIFIAGGIMMTIGAVAFAVVLWETTIRNIAAWVYTIGTVAYILMQAQQEYMGSSLTIKRLKRIQSFSGLLFLLSGFLMIDSMLGLTRFLFRDTIEYLNTMGNKWVLALLCGALVELYTTMRLNAELKKEDRV